jgi:protein FAM50
MPTDDAVDTSSRRPAEESTDANANGGGGTGLVGFAASSTVERVDAAFKASTVGLMTREDFVRRQEEIEEGLAREKAEKEARERKALEDKEKRRKRKRAAKASHKLSFDDDGEAEEEEGGDGEEGDDGNINVKSSTTSGFGLGKDPTVDTGFLPDRAREEAELAERAQIEAEYLERSRKEKSDPLVVTYSFYDGGRRAGGKISLVKGDTVETFLGKCRTELLAEGGTVNRDLRHCDVAGMMYIKEDLILPHDITFYDLIASKARGKSGPLFRFDVKDDVRLAGDARVEREDSHPGKVILRSWYDKNRGMFPANRWEPYVPGQKYAEDGYRIK